ncbi:MAG: hypothetical protein AAGC70_12380 [Pseudomonadota bacterium]
MIRDLMLGLVSMIAVLCAALGWLHPAPLEAFGHAGVATTRTSIDQAKPDIPSIRKLEHSQTAAVLQKPIFFRDRRIPKPNSVSRPKRPKRNTVRRRQVPRTPPQIRLRLLGVVLSGDTQKALVSIDGRAPFWVKVGDRLNSEWRVAKIETNTLTGAAGAREKEFQLYPGR